MLDSFGFSLVMQVLYPSVKSFREACKWVVLGFSPLSSERQREQTSKNNPEFNTHLRCSQAKAVHSAQHLSNQPEHKNTEKETDIELVLTPILISVAKSAVLPRVKSTPNNEFYQGSPVKNANFTVGRMRGWKWPHGGSLEWSLRWVKWKRNMWHQTDTSWRNTSRTAASPTHTSMRSGPTSTLETSESFHLTNPNINCDANNAGWTFTQLLVYLRFKHSPR